MIRTPVGHKVYAMAAEYRSAAALGYSAAIAYTLWPAGVFIIVCAPFRLEIRTECQGE